MFVMAWLINAVNVSVIQNSPVYPVNAYACQFCGDHVYPCVGTPFERPERYKRGFMPYTFSPLLATACLQRNWSVN